MGLVRTTHWPARRFVRGAFQTIFTWVHVPKLVVAVAVAVAVVSGIGASNGWTLATAEVAGTAARDGFFPRPFAWADRTDTAARPAIRRRGC
jgi:amino acid transporter